MKTFSELTSDELIGSLVAAAKTLAKGTVPAKEYSHIVAYLDNVLLTETCLIDVTEALFGGTIKIESLIPSEGVEVDPSVGDDYVITLFYGNKSHEFQFCELTYKRIEKSADSSAKQHLTFEIKP